jgi:spoIIIJ-associated protein
MENLPGQSGPASLEQHLPRLESFLREFLSLSHFQVNFEIRRMPGESADTGGHEVVVDFRGEDSGLLLAKHAELLDAIEHVALKAIRLDDELAHQIDFDCEDVRRLRVAELKLTAQVAAERVAESGSPFELNPMNSRERRIIHLALHDNPQVSTVSEGKGPDRRVIIHPVRPPSRGGTR